MSARTGFGLAGLGAALIAVSTAVFAVGCEDQAFCFDCGVAGSGGRAGSGGAAGSGTGGSAGSLTCTSCATNEVCCLGSCVDLQTSTQSCGVCGQGCPTPAAGTVACVAGKCVTSAVCAMGTADCNGDGTCEANTGTDLKNCGKCGTVCPSTTASPGFCENGICKSLTCAAGTSDCNGKPADGCETKTVDDLANCGGCNTKCPTTPVTNGTNACVGGACVLACSTGFGDCDGDKANGCETNLTTDAKHCGSCGGVCGAISNGTPSCAAGKCVAKCNALFGDCNGEYADGCELALATDPNNCSACGAKCPLDPNGNAPVCAAGSCSAGTCQLGFDDCKATVPGCETQVAVDPLNCGVCGLVCPTIANGTSTCEFFECTVKEGSCKAPFANCFGGITDGCETNLDTTIEHCGACGKLCPNPPNGKVACVSGDCTVASCDPGFADCDGVVDNGCEAELGTDKNNCNGCGLSCGSPINGTASCVGGKCELASCAAGFDSCDGDITNGCETPVTTDPNNCGACKFKCGSGVCTDGKCVAKTSFLILRDTAAAADDEIAKLETFLEAETGFTVDVSTSRFFQYDGTNPALGTYGGILLMAGAPDAGGTYSTDMPVTGQQAIVDFVNAANGLVMTEWAANYVKQGRWQTLKPFVLLERTVAFSGQVDYQIEPAFVNHPIWAGFSQPSFVVNSASNLGITRLGPGIKRVATSTAVLDPVAILELPDTGRVVHLAHSGNYAPFGWSNPNIRKLLANSVRWTTRQN